MTIGFACDHAGWELSDAVRNHLESRGITFISYGTFSAESTDYPDFAHPLALAVEKGEVDSGIAACGTGNGMAITLNKHSGIRAGLAWTPDVAALVKKHNNANILVLPQRFISQAAALECIDAWLDEKFEGGRHAKRIGKISKW